MTDVVATRAVTPGDPLAREGPVLFDPAAQTRALRRAIEAAPKSTRWRLLSRFGDRVTWYAEPEEVAHGAT
jgi:hypothetical protein